MRRPLLHRLLMRHVSAWQLAGFVLANLCGMAIVLVAVQFWTDASPLLTSGDSFMRPGQLVVAKRVSTLSTLSGRAPTFSPREVDDLASQPFVRQVGQFTPAQFSVYASIGAAGMQFGTEMFFEAVPDAFLDVDLSSWHYDADSDEVPIILPRNYLNLYNFGFATSQGLPAISESIVAKVGIQLRLSGTAQTLTRTGRVVAFSRRLNTILVPQQLMDDMNRRLSPERQPAPSRLIVSTSNPADERIAHYLTAHRLDTEATDSDAARAATFLRLLSTIVLLVGLVITALAFYVLLLSIFLLLQKHTEKIDNLLLIGYSPTAIARPFHLLALALNALVLLAAIAIMLALRGRYLPLFGELYPRFEPSAIAPTLAVGMALFLLVSALNFLFIRRKVHRIWHMHQKKRPKHLAI